MLRTGLGSRAYLRHMEARNPDKTRLVVMVSGNGTNLQAIIDARADERQRDGRDDERRRGAEIGEGHERQRARHLRDVGHQRDVAPGPRQRAGEDRSDDHGDDEAERAQARSTQGEDQGDGRDDLIGDADLAVGVVPHRKPGALVEAPPAAPLRDRAR